MAKKKSLLSKMLRGVVKGAMTESAKAHRNRKRRARARRLRW